MRIQLLFLVVFFVLSSVVHAGVNINTASQSELEALKGVGPAKAKAIVEYRTQNGLFGSVDDLAKVNGIGPGTLNQIRNEITVDNASTAEEQEKIAVGQKEASNP